MKTATTKWHLQEQHNPQALNSRPFAGLIKEK
jgi:hypothetical protein